MGAPVRRGGHAGPKGYVFEITGGHVSLDFANTLDCRPTAEPKELLGGYADLVAWSRQAGVLDRKEAEALTAVAARRPAEAGSVLGRAKRVREALFAIFSALAARRSPSALALGVLNASLPEALGRLHLVASRGGFKYAWHAEGPVLDRMLWLVVRAAAELLTSPDVARVRECASDTCAWLFLDRSRNGARRWCDMSVCGNRAKARRHRQRMRGGLEDDLPFSQAVDEPAAARAEHRPRVRARPRRRGR